MRMLLTAVVLVHVPCLAFSGTIFVPDDHATIQAAIIEAVEGDEVVVRPGYYVEVIDFLGKAIMVRSEAGPGVTIIDGNLGGSVVTFSSGEGPDSVLEGFTITNGTGTLVYGWRYGGGVYCLESGPTIVGNVLVGNTAGSGGAIHCYFCPEPRIIGNTITANWASVYGGGICLNDTAGAVVSGNTITFNSADVAGGGIRACCYYSSVTIEGNTVVGNASRTGGGIKLEYGIATITGNVVTNNTADSMGGGIGCDRVYSPPIQGNVISDNEAGDRGGGLFLGGAADPLMTDNRITGNTAIQDGGGVYCEAYRPILVNNAIAGNHSGDDGGGISMGGAGTPVVTGNTFSGNTAAGRGGGIHWAYDSTQAIVDNILWNDDAPQGPEIALGTDDHLSIAYGNVEGGSAQVHLGPGSTLTWAAGMIDADPLFVDPANGDYRLQQDPCQPGITNPCVDAGDPSSPMVAGTTRTDWVQDAGVVDMGYHDAIPLASATLRNAGTNPASYVVTAAPLIGGTYSATVDHAMSGHAAGVLAGYAGPLSIPTSQGYLLVNVSTPEVLGFPIAVGAPALFNMAVPNDPALAGLTIYTQALHAGGVAPFALANAQDLVLGY